MGSTVSTRTCWRCNRGVPDGASMCRYCNTAQPAHSHRAPSSGHDSSQWVSAGPARAAAPARATHAPAQAAPSLAKAGPGEPAPFADNPSFDVWPPREPDHPAVGFSSAPPPGGPTPPSPLGPSRPLRGIASAVVVLFAVETLALLVNGYARFREAGLVADIARDPRSVSFDAVASNADLIESSGWASVGIAVVSLLALMTFLYRATVNARTWDPSVSHAPHMAIVGYLIPVLNLVLPWIVLRQALVVGARRARRAPASWIVLLWALLQTGGFLGRVVFGAQYEQLSTDLTPDLDAARSTIQALAGSSALLALGFAVGIVTVLRIASIHDRPAAA
jgi:hypothetical protein